MSEESQVKSTNTVQSEAGQPTSFKDYVEALTEKHDDITLRQLAQTLQTAPDVNSLIKTYSEQIQATVPHDSISFENKLMAIDLTLGTTARHSCSYTLSFSKESMGRLTLTRADMFSDDELQTLENSLSVLFYPLGHAIFN